jgi:hypothetical protein
MTMPPSTTPLVAPVGEPAGSQIDPARLGASPEPATDSPASAAVVTHRVEDGVGAEPPIERPPVERSGTCTTAQLRRFIKSRAYVPMHEIRRRFLIVSEDDDVTGLSVDGSRIFVGLPEREGSMLGELFRSGEIGYELQLDPRTPVVVGVYPMRPVSRT